MSRLPILLAALAVVSVAHGKKRPEPEAPPPVGWYARPADKKSPGWAAECYFPPVWGELSLLDRRLARQEALHAMRSQWLGERDALVAFEPAVVEELELVLLGRPQLIEELATRNAAFCRDVMAEGASTAVWGAWLAGLPVQLRAGECRRPLDYTMVQYLRLDVGWQEEVPMCQGDRASIQVTVNDRYRLGPREPWINAAGDPAGAVAGLGLPCDREGCLRGQLVGQFVTEEGVETVFPIGTGAVFEAPEHGTLSFAINDDSLTDNRWYSEGAVTDHAAVTIGPAD
jgi:hypothetical protein